MKLQKRNVPEQTIRAFSTRAHCSCDCTFNSEACATGCASESTRQTEWAVVTQSNVTRNDVLTALNG